MARTCKDCVNEGYKVGTETYCTCLYGRQLKAKHEQRVKADKKAIEDTKRVENATKLQKKKSAKFNAPDPVAKEISYAISEGDWTMHGDLCGVVEKMKDDQAHIIISHGFDRTTGKRVNILNKHFWNDAGRYLPAPIETFDNGLEMMVQAAFMLNDKDMFNHATEQMYDNKETREKCLEYTIEWALKEKDKELFEWATKEKKKLGKKK